MSDREVVRCSCCGLNQYKHEDQKCGRCKASYAPPEQQVGSPENPPRMLGESSYEAYSGLPVVARNAKYFREAAGMSQRDLSTKSGLQRTYISKVENGKCTPGIGIIALLAKHLRITCADLLNERQFSIDVKDSYLVEIAVNLPKLNPRYRGCILELVKKMSIARGSLSAQPGHLGREPEHCGSFARGVLSLR